MLFALLIILPLALGAILLAAGTVGRTISARRTFCRSCSYEIAARATICPECGSTIAASSLAIAFSINHPRLAAFSAPASQGRHKASRPLILSGALLLALAAASTATTLYANSHSNPWRALAPSSYLLKTLEQTSSLANAKPTITELRRRAAAGALSPQLHARFERLVNQLTPPPAQNVLAAAPLRSIERPPAPTSPPPRAITRTPSRTTLTMPLFAPPVRAPSIRIVEARPIHAPLPDKAFTADPDPTQLYISPDSIERMQAARRARNTLSPSVLIQHDFEIRTPTFQPVGTISPLYPGLTTPTLTRQRPQTATRAHNIRPTAGRRIKPKRL